MSNNPGWNGLIKAGYIIIGAVCVYFLHSLLIETFLDWDLDAFLYLGSRLDHGELLYFHDFETKLPVVQYLFWIPYRLGGIGAWRIITFAVAAILFVIANLVVVATVTPRVHRARLVVFSSAVSLLFVYSLPGAASAHTYIIAAASMYLAIALCLRGLQCRNESLCNGVSSILAGLAISIRPNYLFTVPAVLACTLVLPRLWSGRYGAAVRQTLVFATGLSMALLAQFVPYLFHEDGPSTVLSALSAMQRFPSGISPATLAQRVFDSGWPTVTFYLFLYASILSIVFGLIRDHDRDPPRESMFFGLLTCLTAVVSLNISIIVSHYWEAYVIMFTPYAAIMVIYSCVLFQDSNKPTLRAIFLQRKGEFAIFSLFLAFVSVSVGGALEKAFRFSRISAASFAINDRNYDGNLLNLLRDLKEDGLSFYVPSNAAYHRILEHQRVGDGHPYMVLYVLKGRRIGPIGDLPLYSDRVRRNPCASLWESGKDLIVVLYEWESELLECLTMSSSNYTELFGDFVQGRRYSGFENMEEYRFFVRRERR